MQWPQASQILAFRLHFHNQVVSLVKGDPFIKFCVRKILTRKSEFLRFSITCCPATNQGGKSSPELLFFISLMDSALTSDGQRQALSPLSTNLQFDHQQKEGRL